MLALIYKMASLTLAVVLLLAVTCSVHALPDLSICDPSNYTYPYEGPPLPKLPNQYHLKVEGNIGIKNYSMVLEEFYDEVNNRGSTISKYGNMTYHTSYDYSLNQTVTVIVNSGNGSTSCTVRDLSKSRFNLYGFHVENGTGHINGTDAVFQFGKEYNETYIGTDSIRGIPSNHWQRCVYHSSPVFNMTFLLDYYFSAPTFVMPFGGREVPVRATVTGSVVNQTGNHTFFHNYEYFDVRPGPVEEERAFEPPLGVVCPGYKRAKKFPDIPEVFSVNVESVIPKYLRTHFTREYYNYKAKLVAYVYEPWSNYSKNSTMIREVHDYNLGLAYRLDYGTDRCSIGPIPVHTFLPDVSSIDGKHVSLRSPYNFLLHNHTSGWIYEGNTTLRDIDAEAWIMSGQRVNGTSKWNFTMEYFFARGNWSSGSQGTGFTHQMPLLLKFSSKGMRNGTERSFEMTQSMFHFNQFTPPHMFDVQPCYDESDSKFLAVDILGDNVYENYVVNNTHIFYAAAQHALANASKLPASRIANIYVVEGVEEIPTIYFTMLGIPPVQGNAVNMTKQPKLEEGIANLEARTLDNEPFVISFTKDGEKAGVFVVPGSLRLDFHPSNDQSKGLGKGAAAGLGISMFILGAVIASAIAFVYIRRIMAPPVPYGVQE